MSTFILVHLWKLSTPSLKNSRYLEPTKIQLVPATITLPEHIELPLDRADHERKIIAFAWKMHNWLHREWELGRRLELAELRETPLEPFATMLKANWPQMYEICGWHRLLREDRGTLHVHEEGGVWYFESRAETLQRHAPAPPPPPPPVFAPDADSELELVAAKLERLFSPSNPNLLSTVRALTGRDSERFLLRMARDYCQYLYPGEPARFLTPELLLPILQQVLPSFLTEELCERANLPLRAIEELGEKGRLERERLEELAERAQAEGLSSRSPSRPLPSSGDVAAFRSHPSGAEA